MADSQRLQALFPRELLSGQTKATTLNQPLGLAATVGAKFRNHGKLQNINLLRFFRSLKIFPDRKSILTRQNFVLDSFDFSARLVRQEFSTGILSATNSAGLFGLTELLDNLDRNFGKDFQ